MVSLWFAANTLLWPFIFEVFGLKLGLNVVALACIAIVWFVRHPSPAKWTSRFFAALCVFMFYSFVIGSTGSCTDRLQKMVVTGPVFVLLTFVGLEIGFNSVREDWVRLKERTPWIVSIVILSLLIEATFPTSFPDQAGYRSEGRLSGLYSEPSILAVTLFPSILVLLASKNIRLIRIGILTLTLVVLLSYSTTIVTLTFCWLLFYLFLRDRLLNFLSYLIGAILLVELFLSFIDQSFLDASAARLLGIWFGEHETDNISSLVYLQGWQDAWINLQRTNGLGLGFNMMGCTPLPLAPAREILARYFHIELNTDDGSTILAKLISETGVVGIVATVLLISWFFYVVTDLRRNLRQVGFEDALIPVVVIFAFIAASGIRSSGYFSGIFLLMVPAAAALVKFRLVRAEKRIQEHDW